MAEPIPVPFEERYTVTITELAANIGRSRPYIYGEIRSGRLPGRKPNPKGEILILMSDVRAWLAGVPSNDAA